MVDLKIQLPEGFLEEEVRDGYLVTSEMKKIWAVELDLLAELDRICKKHGITYLASGGTLLGAIRHNGYIPWDDDIDIQMLRADYDRFCEVAAEEVKHPYFFQTEETDPGYPGPNAKLRNSLTTGVLKNHPKYNYSFNMGIFIDIFPLDTVVSDPELLEKQIADIKRHRHRFKRLEGWYHNYNPEAGSRLIRPLKAAVHGALMGIFKNRHLFLKHSLRMTEACIRYNDRKETYVSKLVFHPGRKVFYLYREDLDDLVEHDFEFMKIPVMRNYDRNLRIHYGEYMTPVQDPSYHGEVIFDTDIPYTEYLQNYKDRRKNT